MAGRHRKQHKRKAPSYGALKKLLAQAGGNLLVQMISNFWL